MTKPKPLLPSEPIWYLRGLGTSAYLQSRHWMAVRRTYTEACDPICHLCGLSNDSESDWVKFHVHHRTYAHLGYERFADLALLCAPCHHLVHYPDSRQAQHWLEVRHFAAPDLEQRARSLDPFALEQDEQSA